MVVVHLANFADVVVKRDDLELLLIENRLGFVASPREVIAIVVEADVGILRSVETAVLAIAEPVVHPANDVAGDVCEERIAGDLVGVNVVLQ